MGREGGREVQVERGSREVDSIILMVGVVKASEVYASYVYSIYI